MIIKNPYETQISPYTYLLTTVYKVHSSENFKLNYTFYYSTIIILQILSFIFFLSILNLSMH